MQHFFVSTCFKTKPLLKKANLPVRNSHASLIESVLNISSCYTFLSVRDKSKLSHIIKHASKITGTTQSSLSDLHTQAVRRKASSIIHDPSHPLHNSFQLRPSGHRYRVPLARTNLVKNSFIPSAINIIKKAL